MELSKHSNINGFTMAEVLITLGILGVVIAMTLPSLIGKWQKNRNRNTFKKSLHRVIAGCQLFNSRIWRCFRLGYLLKSQYCTYGKQYRGNN